MKDKKFPKGVSISTTNISPIKTGSWRKIEPAYVTRVSPCTDLCPCGENIPAWMDLVRKKDLSGAWRELVKENPFPLVCGRVCFRFCEAGCNRKALDDTVSINAIERLLGEHALRNGLAYGNTKKAKRGIRVAVVGGGPAGLTAAQLLAREGFTVVIYEGNKELGGVLRYGIPEYRLPKALLCAEINAVMAGLDIKVRTNYRVTAKRFERILGAFHSVVLALGAHRSKPLLGDDGTPLPLMNGLEFLAQVAGGEVGRFPDDVASVCVVGGGNTAIDVARTALRLGAKEVTILYRRTEDVMPAHHDELLAAKSEGVRFRFLTLPVAALAGEHSRVTLQCATMELVPDGDGKKVKVKRSDAPLTELRFDAAFAAIGEEVDHDLLGARERQFADESDAHEGKIIAAGDALYGPRSVAEAIASGKKAARAILARYDGGETCHACASNGNGCSHSCGSACACTSNSANGDAEEHREVVKTEDIKFRYLPVRRKSAFLKKVRTLAPGAIAAFEETTATIIGWEAVLEADRCINCGMCIACDRCLNFCPDYCITKNADNTYSIDYEMCKGCGLCADVCERGAILFGKEEHHDKE